MSQPGWFHRSGPGSVSWIPAGTTGSSSPALPRQQTSVTTSPPSGRFPVGEVNGNPPRELADFLGVAAFTVIRGDLTYRVFGTGHADGGAVTFRQQDLGWDGRYIRTWRITAVADGLVAEPDTPA